MYEVSNYGVVINIKTGRVLRERPSGEYKKIALMNEYGRRDYFLHRLVAEAFLPGFRDERHVKHYDGDKSNNCLDNVYILDHKIEEPLETRLGVPYSTRGRVRIIETGEEFPSIRMVGRHIRGEYSSIYACLRGERASHLGYTFEWIEE